MSGTSVISLAGYLPAPRYDGLPWTQAKIEEAPTATGTWTLLATKALSPTDSDPTQPAERSFTITNGTAPTGYWYRVTFYDANGAFSEPSDPVFNGDPDLLASVAELETRLGIELLPDEEQRAVRLLDAATQLVRSSAKQHITQVTGDVWTTRGVWGNRLKLPQRPATAITSVTASFMGAAPVTLDPATYFIDRDELVRYDWPLSFSIGNGWLGPGWKITVTYDHGYDPLVVPAPYQLAMAKTIVLEAVTRVWINPEAAQAEMIGGVQTMYSSQGLMLTDEEKEQLADIFRQHAGSVQLR